MWVPLWLVARGARLTPSLFSGEAGLVSLPSGGLKEVSGGAPLLASSCGGCDHIWGTRPLGADTACPSLSHLGNARSLLTVWGGGLVPAQVPLGLAPWVAFPWAESVTRSGDMATAVLLPWHRPLLAKAKQSLSCGMDTGLVTDSGKSPCLCLCPLLAAGVCSRLGQAQGEEPAPAGRAHAAAGSPFAAEEWRGNC